MPKIVKETARPTRRKNPSVLDRIQPIGFDSEGIKINIYGRSGTGKTTFWSTFPRPILALICSGLDKPGELRSIDTPENREEIDHVVIHTSSEIGEVAGHYRDVGKWATLVLDHASGLQDIITRELLNLNEIPVQLTWGMATQSQWGQIGIQVKERLRTLLNLQGNVVIVAQERDFNVDGDSEVLLPYVASALMPSIVGWLNPAVDYICQTFIRNETVEKRGAKIAGVATTSKIKTGKIEYGLRVKPDDVYTIKFRMPKGWTFQPEVLIDPSFDKVMKIIKGE
jgi:hypothetical protein